MLPDERLLDADCLCTIRNWKGQLNRTLTRTVIHADIRCTIILEPHQTTVPIVDLYTDCERDCLQAIQDAGRRLKKWEIIDALTDAGKIHGDSTVGHSLTALVKRGKLIGPPKGTRHGFALVTPVE